MSAIAHYEVLGPIARDRELTELRRRIRQDKSFLVHGESGAGKTFLVRLAAREFPRILYCADSSAGQPVFHSLARELLAANDHVLRRACGRSGAEMIKEKSTLALRGLVMDALHGGRYWVVLDHLSRTSAGLASDVRDMMFWGHTPVLVVARSTHMEDLGFLTALFCLPEERMHVRPFDLATASAFTEQVAALYGFDASNRDDFLRRVVQLSDRLPGRIVTLIKMGLLSRYRTGGHVKFSPLYIDFRLAWHAANAY
jgi:hypothetical protein